MAGSEEKGRRFAEGLEVLGKRGCEGTTPSGGCVGDQAEGSARGAWSCRKPGFARHVSAASEHRALKRTEHVVSERCFLHAVVKMEFCSGWAIRICCGQFLFLLYRMIIIKFTGLIVN